MEFDFSNNVLNLSVDGAKIGYITLGKQNENVFRILRVFVDEAYRGQGYAEKMMDKLVEKVKEENFLLVPICSFAAVYFQKKPEADDVLFKAWTNKSF